jgi:TPP-dependent indolepyruvate ferredoxin oxidoreductase alpha subunit
LHPPTERIPVEVIEDACISCDQCLRYLACPALIKVEESGKVQVDAVACNECGQCLFSCPHGAIVPQSVESAR